MEGQSDLGELAAKFAAHGGGRVSPELSAELALEVVLNEIVEQACLATGASGAAIVLERGGEWVCRASAGGNAPQLGARLDTTTGLSGACVKTRTLQRCDDAQNDPRADIEACRNLGVQSVIVLPLLRNEELAGLFEVFSEWPSAFEERDERTLEALSLRVLNNLERASEPMPVTAEPLQDTPRIAENPIRISTGVPKQTSNVSSSVTSTVASDAASEGRQGSADLPSTSAGSEVSSGRRINFMTLALGAAVLAYAVLLTVLVAQRLSGGRATGRARPPADVSSPRSGNENQAGSGVSRTAVSSGNQSAGSGPSGAASSASSVPATSGAGRAFASAPPGSLLVYENGKEVFRMSPTSKADGVQPAGLVEVSPEMAEGSLVHRVEPDYPEEARRQQMQGAVVLEVRTGRDGAVEEAKVLSGEPLLADAAMAAVKQWRFRPRTVEGEPVEMQTKVTLNFRLPH